jgi:hypothetical protein
MLCWLLYVYYEHSMGLSLLGGDYMLLSGVKSVQSLEYYIVYVNVGFVRVKSVFANEINMVFL